MHALLALSLIVSLHSPAHVPAGHHYGWQRPHNPHHVTVVRPPQPNPGCVWLIGGAIGDIPRCIPTS